MDIADLFEQLLHIKPTNMDKLVERFHMELGHKMSWVVSQFHQLNTLEDKFAFIWNLPEAQQFLKPPNLNGMGKSEDEAERIRTKGNIFYKKNEMEAALHCYNDSILLAPHPELPIRIFSDTASSETYMKGYKTLGYGYANRSAVFLAMKEYDKCISDIDLALEYGYPELLRSKLTERRERCLSAQKQLVGKSIESESIYVNAKKPPVLAEPSQTIPSFSNALKLVYSPARGRHVVATRDIFPGELLAVEKSYCSVTFSEKVHERCTECLLICSNPLPCPNCVDVFCSVDCRTTSLKESHGKECRIRPALFSLGLNDGHVHMALNIFVNSPFDELKEKLPMLQKEGKELPIQKLGFNENGIYSSTDYRSVYHMATMPKIVLQNTSTYSMCLVANILTKMLYESGNFFTNNIGLPLNPSFQDFLVTGTVLLHHLCSQLMSFTMFDTKINFPATESVSTKVGIGLYPSLLLMKHSCDASTTYYDIGHIKIVKSMRLIPAGKEVTLSYCVRFYKHSKVVRAMKLERFGISCSCEACESNWPTYDDLPINLNFKCVKCSKPLNIHRLHPTCFTCDINYMKLDYRGEKKSLVKKFELIVRQIKEANERFEISHKKIIAKPPVRKEDFDAVCKFIVLLEKHIQLPCQGFCNALNILHLYYLRE